jgi:hypothetical protein
MSRHKLFAALAAIGSLATTTPGIAVEVNPDGIGQVLLYPYYTVRNSSAGNALNTLLTVGNTTDHVKAVRVRFREAAVGAPVADLNLYLSAYDMWTGAVIPDAGGGATLLSADRSCTVPSLYRAPLTFSNQAYIGDPLTTSLDRTREGFVEIMAMGDYGLASAAPVGSVAEGVQQIGGGGVPLDCSRAVNDIGTESQAGTGGLFGRAILINVDDGTEFSYSAAALANFNTIQSLWAASNTPGPSLADVNPPISVVHYFDLGTIRTQWTAPIDATSAVLMHESLSNEFVLDSVTGSITDWVITMPTKYFYVNANLVPSRLFQSALASNGACEIVESAYAAALMFDRESSSSLGISIGAATPQGALCWAATVASFYALASEQSQTPTLFGSKNTYALTVFPYTAANASPSPVQTPFQDGWMMVPLHVAGLGSQFMHFLVGGATTLFTPDGSVETQPQATYYGLPVIGFAAESYSNGTLVVNGQTVLSNYGGLIGHRYTNVVQ